MLAYFKALIPLILRFCEHFLIKTCFSIHITQSCVHFTWFALSASKYLMTDLCSSLHHCLICQNFDKPQNQYLFKIIFTINQIPTNAKFTFVEIDSGIFLKIWLIY